MPDIVICLKPSRTADIRRPVGARYDEIYPCHGHLLRFSEPEDVNPAWKSRSLELLKPKTFYPFRPDEAMARQQSDQVHNLNLTQAATVARRPPGERSAICRELETRHFTPIACFEVTAEATTGRERFVMRHAPPGLDRLPDRAAASMQLPCGQAAVPASHHRQFSTAEPAPVRAPTPPAWRVAGGRSAASASSSAAFVRRFA